LPAVTGKVFSTSLLDVGENGAALTREIVDAILSLSIVFLILMSLNHFKSEFKLTFMSSIAISVSPSASLSFHHSIVLLPKCLASSIPTSFSLCFNSPQPFPLPEGSSLSKQMNFYVQTIHYNKVL
jgi:hypothetical protein